MSKKTNSGNSVLDVPKCFFKELSKSPKTPKGKYTLVSFSIFFASDYQRHFYTSQSRNLAVQRQLQFLYNMTLNIENLDNGFLPEDWYFRIYYDKSIFNFVYNEQKPWLDFFKTYQNNPKVQFVEFRCPAFSTTDTSHLNLFGTITRLYPVFEKDPNRDIVIVFDADMFITKGYVNQIEMFKESSYGVNAFCSKYEVSFYKHERSTEDGCYLRTGMFSTKAHLPPMMWDFILQQIKEFQDTKFTEILSRVQFRWALLMPEKPIKSYKEFEYGMDEIILNHYLRKMLKLEGFVLRMVRYKPNTQAIFLLLTTYLKYNYKKSVKDRQKIEDLLKPYLKNTLVPGNIDKNLSMFIDIVRKIPPDPTYEEVYPIILPLRERFSELESLYISQTVLSFIKEASKEDYESPSFSKYFSVMEIPSYILPEIKKVRYLNPSKAKGRQGDRGQWKKAQRGRIRGAKKKK